MFSKTFEFSLGNCFSFLIIVKKYFLEMVIYKWIFEFALMNSLIFVNILKSIFSKLSIVKAFCLETVWKAFSQNRTLLKHLRIHTSDKFYTSELYQKVFSDTCGLWWCCNVTLLNGLILVNIPKTHCLNILIYRRIFEITVLKCSLQFKFVKMLSQYGRLQMHLNSHWWRLTNFTFWKWWYLQN